MNIEKYKNDGWGISQKVFKDFKPLDLKHIKKNSNPAPQGLANFFLYKKEIK